MCCQITCDNWQAADHRKRGEILTRLRYGRRRFFLMPIVLVRLVAPSIEEIERRPEALVVRVVDGVGGADEPNAGSFVRRAPRDVLAEVAPLLELDRLTLVVHSALRWLQPWKELARDVDLDSTLRRRASSVLADDVDVRQEVGLRHGAEASRQAAARVRVRPPTESTQC